MGKDEIEGTGGVQRGWQSVVGSLTPPLALFASFSGLRKKNHHNRQQTKENPTSTKKPASGRSRFFYIPYPLCLFSILRQLINPYISLAKNITKQATIGTLEMSARAAITHSTISTRSFAA